jgi:hypothetical protein
LKVLQKLRSRLRRKPKVTQTLSAKIIRANGTVEDLGVISETKSEGWGVKADG